MTGNIKKRTEKIPGIKKENFPTTKSRKGIAQTRETFEGLPAGRLSPSLKQESLLSTRSDTERASLALQMQQTLGNTYVQNLLAPGSLQTKLSVSQPADPAELEADKMADMVARAGNHQVLPQEVPEEEEELALDKTAGEMQRQEEEEELALARQTADIQLQEIPEEEELAQAKLTADVQRQEEEEELMMTPAADDPTSVSPTLENRITALQGSGQSLNEPSRQNMEQQFNSDFSEVKVHNDAEADQLSRQLNAEAFTVGRDIFFKQGNYQPESEDGQRLLAHELTHVVQQQPEPTVKRQARRKKSAG